MAAPRRRPPLLAFLLALAALGAPRRAAAGADTWAVLASTSRQWLNYRHAANALAVHGALRRLGIPERRIVLMLADCPACDARNPAPGVLRAAPGGADLAAGPPEVDFRGRGVSVAALLDVLAGRHAPDAPPGQRLDSTANSSVLLFLTGHGGDGFLKFHDEEELLAEDLAAAAAGMAAAGRYGRLLIVADTCQAATLFSGVTAPRWAGLASSRAGQSSYALHADGGVGAHLVDEFSSHLAGFLNRLPGPDAEATLGELAAALAAARPLSSSVVAEARGFGAPLDAVRVTEFFAGAGDGGGARDGGAWAEGAWGRAAADAEDADAAAGADTAEAPSARRESCAAAAEEEEPSIAAALLGAAPRSLARVS
jgi:phosphatidylinositol glycan class K